MTEAQRIYEDYGGCSCHQCAPCSFCMSLTEEEADAYWNGGSQTFQRYWKENAKRLEEESQWVTIYNYE